MKHPSLIFKLNNWKSKKLKLGVVWGVLFQDSIVTHKLGTCALDAHPANQNDDLLQALNNTALYSCGLLSQFGTTQGSPIQDLKKFNLEKYLRLFDIFAYLWGSS